MLATGRARSMASVPGTFTPRQGRALAFSGFLGSDCWALLPWRRGRGRSQAFSCLRRGGCVDMQH